MAVYFDYKVQSSLVEAKHELINWHRSFPLLAVASTTNNDTKGVISFYLDEGEALENSLVEKPSIPKCLAWHPTRKVLASGWDNGEVSLWNEHDTEQHEAPAFHQGAITCMMWNGTGSRLITADENGYLAVWKVDQRGRVQSTPMFKHEVGSGVVQMVFKVTVGADVAADIAAAARAAVNGDESALDMFSWQKSGGPKLSMGVAESIQLFFGTKDGNVYFLDDRGKCNNKFRVEGAVKFLMYYETRDMIITITESLLLSQHLVKPDGECSEQVKVKLSGQAANSQVTWAGSGLIATASKEQVVRVLDINNDQNYVLNLDTNAVFQNGETINCISYSKRKGILAAGTSKGHVAMWKYNLSRSMMSTRDTPWELLAPSELFSESITSIKWASNRGLLAVSCQKSSAILSESIMNAHFNQQVAAVQVSPSQLSVEMFPAGTVNDLKTDVHIKGVYVTKEHTTIWNNKKVVIYEINENKSLVRAIGSFNSDSSKVAVHEQSVYLIEPEKVTVRTFQGTVKQEIPFTEAEGDPIDMNINGNFLAIATNKSVLRIYDLSRREARQVGPTKSIEDSMSNIGQIKTVKCNCNGSKVAFICESANNVMSPFLYVWDVESDALQCFDFATGKGRDDLDEALASTQQQLTSLIKECIPRSIFWDTTEAKLLVCETVRIIAPKTKTIHSFRKREESMKDNDNSSSLIVSLFSTPDHGLIVQDHFITEQNQSVMLGVNVPYYYFAKPTAEDDEPQTQVLPQQRTVQTVQAKGVSDSGVKSPTLSQPPTSKSPSSPKTKNMVVQRTMRDFVGLEDANENVKQAMTNFSYLSAIGNMDEAFKAIKTIKRLDYEYLDLRSLGMVDFLEQRDRLDDSGSVWENMARMCVKTKRLDVAMVCLGNMSNAAAAKAVREACKEPEVDARVAMLAIQLGMVNEAESLYKECGRYDLLNQFYQAANDWSKAIDVAENHDRIHLRTTYYNYGKYLESVGNFNGAIQQFERSDTHRFEVPRMLFDDQSKLETYVNKAKDRGLRKWWAQYMESVGDMQAALHYYEAAQDYLSLVRVHCYCGNIDKAAEICNDTGNKAACYHLARQYDGQGDIKSAIHYFSRAQAYANAIRLAKENERDHELMNLALLSSPEDMLDAARYFEEKENMEDKAVMLYHKGGSASKAIELAFRTEQFGALQLISEDLDENTNPDVLNKCADFFMDHGQFDRAVNLLVVAKRYKEALEMCMDHHVTITEELAEKISLPKDHPDQQYRSQLLEKIAECAFKQGSYHLATKKFTQAGNKIKAMKSLLKSGDTEKIVFFAGVSRQREIYVMAANYLQSLDWRQDPEIMKNIIGFYTKGRALDSLASFYDACAQVEIDEYQNYEKAFGALTEGYKALSKAKMKNQTQQEERLASMKSRLTIMKKFITAKRAFEENPDETAKQCHLLLEDPDAEEALRIGDVYALLVQHYTKEQNYNQAYELMEDLRKRTPTTNLSFYIDTSIIEHVYKAVGASLRGVTGTKNGIVNGNDDSDIEDGEILDEEVPDEADDEFI